MDCSRALMSATDAAVVRFPDWLEWLQELDLHWNRPEHYWFAINKTVYSTAVSLTCRQWILWLHRRVVEQQQCRRWSKYWHTRQQPPLTVVRQSSWMPIYRRTSRRVLGAVEWPRVDSDPRGWAWTHFAACTSRARDDFQSLLRAMS